MLSRIKASVRASRLQAQLAVNRELINLYWAIGSIPPLKLRGGLGS